MAANKLNLNYIGMDGNIACMGMQHFMFLRVIYYSGMVNYRVSQKYDDKQVS